MSSTPTHYVYQEPAIEFVTVAVQLCLYLEQVAEHEKSDFIENYFWRWWCELLSRRRPLPFLLRLFFFLSKRVKSS